MKDGLTRKDFLRMAATAALAWGGPAGFLRRLAHAASGSASIRERLLVLIELSGGNDGLNTVIPYKDAEYYRLRPTLAVPREQVLRLGGGLGLHPKLEPLAQVWRSKELAIVNGVGYPDPNRSHFRSIDIWETASGAQEYLSEGWLARLFAANPLPMETAADGIVLGGRSAGPLSGSRSRPILMDDPKKFFKQARRIKRLGSSTSNPSLRHILKVQGDIASAAQVLERRLESAPELPVVFPKTRLGRQMATVARLAAAKTPVLAYKATLGGFDTHSQQKGTHERNLEQLGKALEAFRIAMGRFGLWDQTLVMTYSEFGRRVKENASRGTDHGTAAPHFLLGGRVRGGMYGRYPSLSRLQSGDLRHHLDFRSLYATVGRRWWGTRQEFLSTGRFDVLDCFRS